MKTGLIIISDKQEMSRKKCGFFQEKREKSKEKTGTNRLCALFTAKGRN
jgi:hypothetical protein